MTNEQFVQEFGHLVGAPGGTGALRRLIRRMAVDGSLLPGGEWGSTRLGDVMTVKNGAAFKSGSFNEDGRGMPLVRIRDVRRGYTETWYDGPFEPAFVVRAGDLLVGMDGRFDHALWQSEPALLNQRVCRLDPTSPDVLPRYVDCILGEFLEAINDSTSSTTVKHLSSKTIAEILLPLPPVDQQTQIIDRVNELWALCDEIEETQRHAEAHRVATARSALAAIVESDRSDADRAVRLVGEHVRQCLAPGEGTAEVLMGVRGAILELAVRGRLTPQNDGDEPADDLHARVIARQQELVVDGAIRKPKPLPAIEEGELPYRLPVGWRWIRAADLVSTVNGRAFKPNEWTTSGLPIIRIQNLNRPDAPFNYFDGDVDPKFLVNSGDLLISWSGTPGTSFGAFIWDRGPGILNQHIFKCRLFDDYRDYLRLAINSRLDVLIADAHGGVGLQHFTKGKLERLPLPIPPLEEQKRIVTRFQELMSLCDEIEAAAIRERELAASLAEAACAALIAQAPFPA